MVLYLYTVAAAAAAAIFAAVIVDAALAAPVVVPFVSIVAFIQHERFPSKHVFSVVTLPLKSTAVK